MRGVRDKRGFGESLSQVYSLFNRNIIIIRGDPWRVGFLVVSRLGISETFVVCLIIIL